MSYGIRFKAFGSEEHLEQEQEARGVLTDWLSLESAGLAALAFTFPIDGGHPDLICSFWFQISDGDPGHVCWRQGGVIP